MKHILYTKFLHERYRWFKKQLPEHYPIPDVLKIIFILVNMKMFTSFHEDCYTIPLEKLSNYFSKVLDQLHWITETL